MNIRKLTFYISSLCAFILFSCTTRDDSFTPPEGSNPVAFFVTSIVEANNDREFISRVGFEAEFLDTSIGTDGERLWEIPENDVRIVSGDINSEKIVLEFLTEGDVEIKLNRGTFSYSETIIVLQGAQATFTVEPVDPSVTGFSFDPTSRTIIAEAGTVVQFTATATGGLDEFDWKFPGQTPSFSEELSPIVTLKKLGESEYNFRARSVVPFGDIRLPNYGNNEPEAFYKVIVNPSSLPLTVSPDVIENADGQIAITYSRDLDPTTLDPASSFTLTVDGMAASIQSISLDPSNAAILLVTPTEDIKNTQTATIAYNAVSLISTDGVAAPSVPATAIQVFTGIDLFANGNFEGVTTEEYVVTSDFQGAGNRAAIDASFPDGVGVDNSRALVYTVTGATAGDRRAIFGDKQKDTDESRVQLITPLQNGVTYTVKAMFKFTGVKPTSFELGVVNFRFIGPSLVYANLDISSVVEGADFVEVEGTFTTQNLVETDGIATAYPIPRLTAGTGDSVITVDNIVVTEREE